MSRGIGSYISNTSKRIIKTIPCCVYCGAKERLHIDHIHPIAKGGRSNIENLTMACFKCNGYKSDFAIEVFFQRIIDKRSLCYNKINSYCGRLERLRKRKDSNQRLQNWLIDRINENRVNHTYFTKIIRSIATKNYIPCITNG